MRVGVIAERDHEVRVAVMFEVFQQVPEDRLVTDEDHGLGLDPGLLSESGAPLARHGQAAVALAPAQLRPATSRTAGGSRSTRSRRCG